jgi:hypothetical protein
MSYIQEFTVEVLYYDTWEGHSNQGISGGEVNVTSLNEAYVKFVSWEPDATRPGWYLITLRSEWGQGSAVVLIELSKDNYETAIISIAVSVEPSEFNLLIQNSLFYGLPIGVICIIGAILCSVCQNDSGKSEEW